MSYRISSQAEAQLDDIWLYQRLTHRARESGSVDTAIRVVENISDRFWLLAGQPRMGRRRPNLSDELRSFAAGDYVILYSIEDDDVVLIHLRVPWQPAHRGFFVSLEGRAYRPGPVAGIHHVGEGFDVQFPRQPLALLKREQAEASCVQEAVGLSFYLPEFAFTADHASIAVGRGQHGLYSSAAFWISTRW